MGNLGYMQLVLLTESPGARIGRIDDELLSAPERTVATLLDWCLKSSQAARSDDDYSLHILLRNETPAWWQAVFSGLQEIGALAVLRRLQLALRVLGVALDLERSERAARLSAIDPRRNRLAARLMWRVWDRPIEAALAAYAIAHAQHVPGTQAMATLAST